MVRNGKTAAGSQRWLCKSCRATTTHKLDNTAKQLKTFLKWLLSNERQADMAGGGRTFRRKCSKFWSIWPLAPITGEVHHVVFVDGIYLARNVVVLIACTQEHVIGWYLARSENSRSWAALMGKIPPPDVVVCDGGTGFEKARKRVWPTTRVQRCAFMLFAKSGRRRRHVPSCKPESNSTDWPRSCSRSRRWLQHWPGLKPIAHGVPGGRGFLAERTLDEESGRMRWTHERLVTARNGLNRLVSKNLLFTFLDPELACDGPIPSMNNKIEGGINAQLRRMLRDHRGLSLTRRAKAIFWWCYVHTEVPLPAAEILKTMPTDDDIEELYRQVSTESQRTDGPEEWGDGLVWAELRHALPWRAEWD